MRFAEMTQEVQIARPTPRKLDIGFTPGRRKANQVFKMALGNLEEQGHPNARRMEIDLGLVYSLGPKIPHIKLNSPETDQLVRNLMELLEKRIHKRHTLSNDLEARRKEICLTLIDLSMLIRLLLFCFTENNFRMQLVELDKLQATITTDNSAKSVILHREREKISALESKVVIYENRIDDLEKMVRDREERIAMLEAELDVKRHQVNKTKLEKEKQREKYTTKIAQNERNNRDLENKLRDIKDKELEMRRKDDQLRQVKDILNNENVYPVPHRTQDAEFHGSELETRHNNNPTSVYHTPRPKVNSQGIQRG